MRTTDMDSKRSVVVQEIAVKPEERIARLEAEIDFLRQERLRLRADVSEARNDLSISMDQRRLLEYKLRKLTNERTVNRARGPGITLDKTGKAQRPMERTHPEIPKETD
jgi:uncharacterized protein YlxW (UPF0749 family)